MGVLGIITIILVILGIVLILFCIAGANRAFSTPEQLAWEDDEQWRIINGK